MQDTSASPDKSAKIIQEPIPLKYPISGEVRKKTQNIGSSDENFTCDICKKNLKKDDLVEFECGHHYHIDCIKQELVHQINTDIFPVMCTIDDCEQEPSMFLLSLLVSREHFQACIEFEQSLCQEIKENNCYNCGQRFLSDIEVTSHRCLKCKKMNCLKCHGQYHSTFPCPPPRTARRKSPFDASARVQSLSPPSIQNTLRIIKRSPQQKNLTEGQDLQNSFTFQEYGGKKNQSVFLKPQETTNSIDSISLPKPTKGQKILSNISNIANISDKNRSPLPFPYQRPQSKINAAAAKMFTKVYQSNILIQDTLNQSNEYGGYSPLLSPVNGYRSLNGGLVQSETSTINSLTKIQNQENQPILNIPKPRYQSPNTRRVLIGVKQPNTPSHQPKNEGSSLRIQKSSDSSLQNTSLYEPEVAAVKRKSFQPNQILSANIESSKPKYAYSPSVSPRV